jgi:acetyl esterase/lipase
MCRLLAIAAVAAFVASCVGPMGSLVPMRMASVRNVVYTPPDWPAPMAGDIHRPPGEGVAPAILLIHGGGPPVKAIVAGAAPSNLTYYSEGDLIRNFLGGTLEEVPEVFHEASPVNHVTPASPPFFLYHGENDTLVHPDHLREMEVALKANGVPHEIFWIRGKGHITAFLFPGGAIESSIRFLDHHLKEE